MLTLAVAACSPAGSASSTTSQTTAPAAAPARPASPDGIGLWICQRVGTPDRRPHQAALRSYERRNTRLRRLRVATGAAPSGTLVVARTGDIDKLDPALATAFQTIETLGLVYNGLVATDDNGKLIPSLATKWSTSADGKTVTFDLRTGVTWQDGDPFTVGRREGLDRADPRREDRRRRPVQPQDSSPAWTPPMPNTVVLHLSAPNAAILYALSGVNSAILHDEGHHRRHRRQDARRDRAVRLGLVGPGTAGHAEGQPELLRRRAEGRHASSSG